MARTDVEFVTQVPDADGCELSAYESEYPVRSDSGRCTSEESQLLVMPSHLRNCGKLPRAHGQGVDFCLIDPRDHAPCASDRVSRWSTPNYRNIEHTQMLHNMRTGKLWQQLPTVRCQPSPRYMCIIFEAYLLRRSR